MDSCSQSITRKSRVDRKAFARRFWSADKGATAVEFALVATPFLMLLFGIMELAVIFLVTASLENATQQATRTIRTGELQGGSTPTAASFKATLCDNFGFLQSDCQSNVYVDVREFNSFQTVSQTNPVVNGNFNQNALTFDPAGPNCIVVATTYYVWPLFVPMMNQALVRINGGKTLIRSTSAFRNEPFGGSNAC